MYINVRNLSFRNIKVENTEKKDWPDFKNSNILQAEWKNSGQLTQEELDWINTNRRDVVVEAATWLFHSRVGD